MSVRAPISVCLIVKNEPLLEQCIRSIREYVEEIVIVDTGSSDDTIDIAKKYADVFESFSECNDSSTGLMENFSLARQKSFNLANQKWIMWIDADDIISGAENLLKLTEQFSQEATERPVALLFPYEYSYNDDGLCVCVHYRERLISDNSKFHWINPVHEVIINDDSSAVFYTREDVVFKHQRQYGNKIQEPMRNYRILKKFLESRSDLDIDARQYYYFGLECFNIGLFEDSIQNLSKYIDLSGWDDERAMACLKLIDIYQLREDYETAIKWAFKLISIKESWAEGYFNLGKLHYFIAQKDPVHEMINWQKCANFIRLGLSFPPTKTLLFLNPTERTYEIHKYYNVALGKLGQIEEALNSVNIALTVKKDEDLYLNKRIYETIISIRDTTTAINKLRELDQITLTDAELIIGIINKQLMTKEVAIENSQNKDQDIINSITSLKKYNENISEWNEEFSPVNYNSELTNNKLDIIFFAGDGLEAWTPDTVKDHGIGGSETMLLEQAKRLASFGHKVRVYNSCGNKSGIYDKVEYNETIKFCNLECDVLIVSRAADALSVKANIKAKIRLLWVHDIYAINGRNIFMLKADRVLALSNWHKDNLINAHNIHPEHIKVTRNGIDLKRFDKKIERNRFKVVNSSSPDRSWLVLLECWKKIKERVPKAELHLFYGFKNLEYIAKIDKSHADLMIYLKQQIKEMVAWGVVYHDRINQDELATQFLSAGVWAHPTWFTETSCSPAGALVFTKNGMKLIEDICVGDLVLTHKARFRPVTKLIKKNYIGKMYSIKRKKDFHPIKLTEEHPLYISTFHKRNDSVGRRIYDNIENQKFSWKSPLELVEKRDYLVSPKMEFGNLDAIKITDYVNEMKLLNGGICGIENNIHKTPHPKCHIINNEIVLTYEFMYMLGLFAAEGCVSKSKNRHNYSSIVFAFHLRELCLAQKMISFFGKGTIKQTSEHGITLTIYSSSWAHLLKVLIGTGRSKRIPSFVWDTSQKLQQAFIDGMCDGDGSFSLIGKKQNKYEAFRYTTISSSLAYGLAQLLANQGIYSSISFNNERKNYDLLWTSSVGIKPCKQHVDVPAGYATRVQSVTNEDYNGIVYNFEVEEDKSYVTDRTIVHNCITAMEAQAAGLRMVTSGIAALNETVGNRGILLDGEWTSNEYKNNFIEAVISAINYDGENDRLLLQQYARDNFSLDNLAKDWERMFYDLIEQMKINPMIPYYPTIDFRK